MTTSTPSPSRVTQDQITAQTGGADNSAAAPRRRRAGSPIRRSGKQTVLLYLGALWLLVFSIFPLYWMIITALRPAAKLLRTTSLVPGPFSLQNFHELFTTAPFARWMLNSFVVSLALAVLNLAVCAPIAYLMARRRSRLLRAGALGILIGYMMPETLLLVPIFIVIVRMHLANSLVGLTIALLCPAMPLGLWLLVGFFRNLPLEVEEAAWVDGASWTRTFWHVVLPMARSGLITVGIFSFLIGWTDYLFALTLISDDPHKTLPVGLATVAGQLDSNWGVVMAGAAMIAVPTTVFGALVSRFFVRGLTQGAAKG